MPGSVEFISLSKSCAKPSQLLRLVVQLVTNTSRHIDRMRALFHELKLLIRREVARSHPDLCACNAAPAGVLESVSRCETADANTVFINVVPHDGSPRWVRPAHRAEHFAV